MGGSFGGERDGAGRGLLVGSINRAEFSWLLPNWWRHAVQSCSIVHFSSGPQVGLCLPCSSRLLLSKQFLLQVRELALQKAWGNLGGKSEIVGSSRYGQVPVRRDTELIWLSFYQNVGEQ